MKGLSFTRVTSPDLARGFRGMTFPKFVPWLERVTDLKRVVAVAAFAPVDNPVPIPVGLALAVRDSADSAEGEMVSLFVTARLRRRGIGAGLVRELETIARKDGWQQLRAVYMTRLAKLADFESVLIRRGWNEPRLRMYIFQSTRARLQQADFMPLFQELPPGFEIKPWSSLSRDQRLDLEADLDDFESEVPRDVNPLHFEGTGIDGSDPEPSLSLAAVAHGRVVGWHLAHRISPKAARFSCSFIRPSYQQRLPVLAMWIRAFTLLNSTSYQQVSWSVSPHHEAMVRFNQRLMMPYVEHFDETRGSTKDLLADA